MKRKHKRGNKNARRPVMKVIIKREMVKEAEVIIDKMNRAYGCLLNRTEKSAPIGGSILSAIPKSFHIDA